MFAIELMMPEVNDAYIPAGGACDRDAEVHNGTDNLGPQAGEKIDHAAGTRTASVIDFRARASMRLLAPSCAVAAKAFVRGLSHRGELIRAHPATLICAMRSP